MFTINSGFIGQFKTGDNINQNLKTLALLYSYYERSTPPEKSLLNKPIIILLISIIEAVLHDFHFRIGYPSERVQNLATSIVNYINGKKIDEFKKYIDSAKKHDLLDSNNPDFYDKLDFLRKMRNRIHIQNKQNELEANEYSVFTEERKKLAEQILEQTLKVMSAKYARPEAVRGFVTNFTLPWNEHIQPSPELPAEDYLEWLQNYYGMTFEQLQLMGII